MSKQWGDERVPSGRTDVIYGALIGWTIVLAAYLGMAIHGWLG